MHHPQVSGVLQTLLDKAISDFTRDFYDQIKNGASEVNLAHQLLIKINQYLPSDTYDTDLDYNRIKFKDVKKSSATGNPIRPDIVIHKRGIKIDNRLVIEIKRKWTGEIDSKDQEKLEMFTDPLGDYSYDYGLFLAFDIQGIEASPILRWFKSGRLLLP